MAVDRSGIDTGLLMGYWTCSLCCSWWDPKPCWDPKPALVWLFFFFCFLADYPAKQFGSILISASRGITISLLPKRLLLEATALLGMELPEHEYFMGLVLGRLLMVEFSWPITRFL